MPQRKDASRKVLNQNSAVQRYKFWPEMAGTCANPGCTAASTKTCFGCNLVLYCSDTCLKQDRPHHESACETSEIWNAYSALGIEKDFSLPDEDVAVAYYRSRGSSMAPLIYPRWALESIAAARKSRFLRFLTAIEEHLNEKNVAVLAKKTFDASPEPEDVDEEVVDTETVGEGFAGGESSQDLCGGSSESEMEVDASGEGSATGEDGPSEISSPYDSEASVSSDNEMSADSDFSQEVGGVFFDLSDWRCEECSAVLVDWKCPNGHEVSRCKTCGWQLDDGSCPKCLGMRGDCDGERVHGQCGNCGAGEDGEDEDDMTYDERDGLWRCMYCHWEVGAENETDGNCHCMNDKGEAHFIDLSDYLDYEPADSCSSEDDSSDSEANSGDEGFIDDTEITLNGSASNAAMDVFSLVALYPTVEVAKIIDPARMAKAAAMDTDKENIEPTAGSKDIEIIDAPATHGQSRLQSNIIDCESMYL